MTGTEFISRVLAAFIYLASDTVAIIKNKLTNARNLFYVYISYCLHIRFESVKIVFQHHSFIQQNAVISFKQQILSIRYETF